ncbi:MAG TPA: glucoamylase family protein [Candidatus Eisenbacteria bacterium]|nr:glucoamylase family protein [Candidatus Eisenbacteria bacterium]
MSDQPPTDRDPSRLPTEDELNRLQVTTLQYYMHEANPTTGLIRDKTDPAAPASIAAVGLALASIPVLVERGVISREFAPEIALWTLRFFRDSPQGPEPDATGYRGFYYHFLHMKTGRRVWECELSAIDSAFLFAGMLTCAAYFDAETQEEAEVRRLADELYRRADWRWMLAGGSAISHGWRPETGFIPHTYTGYDEALLLYLLGLGSPTFPLPPESYAAYSSTYQWRQIYGHDVLYSGPLFTHQLSQLWIDFRGIRDAFMRAHGSDYFENSRRATYIHQEYARRNPLEFAGYGEHCWGITASDGPGSEQRCVNGVEREFYGYHVRGAPYGPDDGTLSPWVVVGSLPFAPEIVIPTVGAMARLDLGAADRYGFKASFNETYLIADSPTGWWVTPYHFGIDQGPVALMIENYRTGLIWKVMRRCPYVVAGLRRAGFQGGWL